MPADYKERAFEAAIEDHLLATGYAKGDNRDFDVAVAPNGYDRARGLFPGVFVGFVKATQPQAWAALEKLHAGSTGDVLVDALCKAIAGSDRGSLEIIRHGFKCYGRQIDVAFFKPSSGLNPETQRLYGMNVLTVTRQVYYSGTCEKSIDVVLALNGVPIITAELKNPMSGQTAEHAKTQYRLDRDERELLFAFKQRALVHFAVDPDVVWMTTRLRGKETFFLPFNKGNGTGAGNPENPAGHRTSYLWEQTWQKDSLLDIISRFLHLQVEEKRFTSGTAGRKVRKETMIFPRYHQLDVVRRMEADARALGTGHNYLVQHSAGSGKSNSIGWLAHRLASLHDDNDRRVFDSVIVVTDRVVLDQQLQDTIYQFEHKHGVVQKIDENSTQLAEAIKTGVPIIITTLQKFPFVTEKVAGLPDRRYAVIVDEAHSSQSGETATELKGVLAADHIRQEARRQAEAQGIKEGEEGADAEEEILRTMLKRGRQPNISFFAFTATPKYKTLEVFGRVGTDGRPAPFHLYSMRQAIEEGFILDVLRNYTSYGVAFRLAHEGTERDSTEVERSAALKKLMGWVRLHPYNIAQKVEVVVEHFRAHVAPLLAGKAKAMVVVASRVEAVRWKLAIDKYIAEKQYPIGTLAAFSGEVNDKESSPDPVSEHSKLLNPDLKGRDIREAFKLDDYRILLVANKFQTGFDQPLLCGMYVDKRLAGIQAVQTLSRLNRAHPGKDTTYILDFVNDPAEILAAFKTYFETAELEATTDPNLIFDLRAKLDASGCYDGFEVDRVATVEADPRGTQAQLSAAIAPVADRLLNRHRAARQARAAAEAAGDAAAGKAAKDELDALVLFRGDMGAFNRLYAFLSQMFDYGNTDIEKRFIFYKRLVPLLEFGREREEVDLSKVVLTHHTVRRGNAPPLYLGAGETLKLPPIDATGSGFVQDKDRALLDDIIEKVNGLFEGQLTDGDQLVYVNGVLKGKLLENETLVRQAASNSKEQFANSPDLKDALLHAIMDALDAHTAMSTQALGSERVRDGLRDILLGPVKLYEALRARGAGPPPAS